MSLLNVSLKLIIKYGYMLIFLLKKNVSNFCILLKECEQKLFIFFQQNTCELDIVLNKTVNILTTYELVKLTTR